MSDARKSMNFGWFLMPKWEAFGCENDFGGLYFMQNMRFREMDENASLWGCWADLLLLFAWFWGLLFFVEFLNGARWAKNDAKIEANIERHN